MIGIGKWAGSVDTMFFKGNVSFTIADHDGQYAFEMDLPEGVKNVPDFSFTQITESGNTLNAQAEISLLPEKKIDAVLTFDGDTMNGQLKVPFIGKIALKDFKRVGM